MTQAHQKDKAGTNVIRVLLVEMTGIAADLVRQVVAQQEDIEIVGCLPEAAELGAVAGVPSVELLITEYRADRESLRRLDPILASNPGLRALAVEEGGRAASMYELKPHLRRLGPLSAEGLIEFIRRSAAHPPGWES
jgi:hypothetical protein